MSKQFHDGFGNPVSGNIRESDGVYLNANGLPSVLGGNAFEVGKAIDTRGADEIGTVDDCMADACVDAFKPLADAANRVLDQIKNSRR